LLPHVEFPEQFVAAVRADREEEDVDASGDTDDETVDGDDDAITADGAGGDARVTVERS